MASGNSVIFSGENSLYSKVVPTDQQYETLQLAWNELRDFLIPYIRKTHAYTLKTWIQGSYKYRTLIRPLAKEESYDLDLGVYFLTEEVEGTSASSLREMISDGLTAYMEVCENVKKIEKQRKRCLRIVYKDDFHIDIPVYILDEDSDLRTLAVLPDDWEQSDPKQLYMWFKQTVPESERPAVRRLIQYIKGWAIVAFRLNQGAAISSITTTVLAARFYSSLPSTFISWNDEERLIEFVKWMKNELAEEFRVNNPINLTENLCRIENANKSFTTDKINILRAAVEQAEAAETCDEAIIAWEQAFGYLIELPTDVDVLLAETSDFAKSYLPVVAPTFKLPSIRIKVLSKDKKTVLRTCINAVANLTKENSLDFSIENAHELPPNSRAIWTVRNGGQEASDVFDLGHITHAASLNQTIHETIAYTGRHFMDCAIVTGAKVHSLVRVPVHVGGLFASISHALSENRRIKRFRGRVQ